MNNLLYFGALVAALGVFGCRQDKPLQIPLEERKPLEIGTYAGIVEGMPAEYHVRWNGKGYDCLLILLDTNTTKRAKNKNTFVYDDSCNNLANRVNEYDRNELINAGREDLFDRLLREARELVKPENKFDSETAKNLDELLKPQK